MKGVEFHPLARAVIRDFSKPVRAELGSALIKLQLGMNLGMPISRPMPSVYPGVHELRFRDAGGIQRVLYYAKLESRILIFHAFAKKTRTTPVSEIATGTRRLKEMLSHEETE